MYFLGAVLIGGLVGFLVHRWWVATIYVAFLTAAVYSGIGIGLWGNGFGENWEYTVPFWFLATGAGSAVGWLLARLRGSRADSPSG
jgi:hypothetical protein